MVTWVAPAAAAAAHPQSSLDTEPSILQQQHGGQGSLRLQPPLRPPGDIISDVRSHLINTMMMMVQSPVDEELAAVLRVVSSSETSGVATPEPGTETEIEKLATIADRLRLSSRPGGGEGGAGDYHSCFY